MIKLLKGLVLASFVFTLTQQSIFAQVSPGNIDGRTEAVFTAIPFLRINPDARTSGMGEVGIATPVDAAALYHNGSKLAFAPLDANLSLSYTPWLRQLVDDIFIAYLTGYKKLDDIQTLGGSIRYFSLGEIQFTDNSGNNGKLYNPNEFAADLGYARRLSDAVSAGITLKYVRSDLGRGQELGNDNGNITKAANAVAADVSFYYNKNVGWLGDNGTFALGAAITNIGNKVNYNEDNTRDFIPINLGIGTSLTYNVNEYNSFTYALDFNKLLVPSPDPSITDINSPDYPRNQSLLDGIFGSFSDAPDGFSEELREVMISTGIEYWYNNQFSARMGYFHENELKGNRKYLTFGIGLRYSVFGVDASYIAPVNSGPQNHPLRNTVRIGLQFNFNEAAL